MSEEIKHILSHRVGLPVVLTLLMKSGAMCPDCGHGTRVTSKNWARCTKCGARVKRVAMESVELFAPSGATAAREPGKEEKDNG